MNDPFNDPQIKELFFSSAYDHIQEMNDALLVIEADPKSKEHIESVFRNAHSLKSESLSMGYSKISELCHNIEDLFQIIRDEGKTLDKEGFSIVFGILDFLQEALLKVQKDEPELDNSTIKNQILSIKQNNVIAISDKNKQKEPDIEKRPVLENIRVSIRILDQLMNIMEELIIERMKLSETVRRKSFEYLPDIEKKFELLITELQYYITQSRLTPIEDVFQGLPRVIRDLSNKLNKKVNVALDLGNLKVDRFIAEALYEPIVHIIRNSFDHGIESPEERKKLGKSEEGNLSIKAYNDKGLAIIEVSDDGMGIDIELAKKKMKEKKNIDASKFSDKEVIDLLFEGGISTSDKVTEYSGRGVGLNVVKAVTTKLGGKSRIDSVFHKGTTFTLEFPFTLAIIKAMLVVVDEDIYAVPVTNIERSIQLSKEKIQEVANVRSFLFEGEKAILISLRSLFNEKETKESLAYTVVVTKSGTEKIGLIVDRILQLEEIIVKPLTMEGEPTYFSGVTILGNNKTVLIIDPQRIVGEMVNKR